MMRRGSDYGDDYAMDESGQDLLLDDEESLNDLSSPPADVEPPSNDNFKVAIRVRPPVTRELEGPRPFVNVVRIPNDHKSITLCEHLDTDDGRSGVYSTQTYTFDYVYDASTRQKEVYERSAQPAVLSVLHGYNATLIAYGQTGTGKTFTMEGYHPDTSDDRRGIIPRSIEEIFSYIAGCKHRNMKFLVRASYLQIYNEVISDLLKPQGKQLTVRHTKQRGVYVDGLSEWVVRSPTDVYGLMKSGTSLRATGSTKMSELSSRSHAMFIIIVEVMEGDVDNPTSYKYGKLNIVDLAGSEKVRQTGVTGQRLEETKNINWSLHELGNVISALTAKRRDKHIPFRNSCLTSALRDSLGGNCKTTLIACISPALDAYAESLSTLKFANRAKNIKNEAVINEDVDQTTLLRRYEKELKRLRQLLRQQGGAGATPTAAGGWTPGDDPDGMISQLQLGKRRAEEDREAALEALQESSRAHHEELMTRKRLEERIHDLEHAISGGSANSESHVLSEEYASRLDELDKERQVMEEDKAQVDRYKQLLLKQRDIMLNLTTRLNERDEQILQLQEELDTYDAHIQQLEDTIEQGQQAFSSRAEAEEHLQRVTVRTRGAASPPQPDNGVRYRSELNADQLLTTEEKMLELLMTRGGRSPSGVSSQSTPGFDKRSQPSPTEDFTAMRLVFKERVEAVASREVMERTRQLRQELETMRTKLSNSEEKRRAMEQLVESAKLPLSTQEALSRAKRYMEQEAETVRATYTARLQALQQELEKESDGRRWTNRELDRIRFELSQIRASAIDSHRRAEIDRLWRGIESLEESLGKELQRQGSQSSWYRDPTAASSSSPSVATSSPVDAARLKALESQLDETKRLHNEQSQQLAERERQLHDLTLSKEHEISTLNKSLSTHMKDRRALKTIMESRIKTKVDTISDLYHGGPAVDKTRIASELRALQNLVNASITAMDS